ncbi:Organic solvent tolerance protein OstA [Phaeobacter sp. CECT 5382]|uniref:LPS export ABC transporter periplasmic protein LptC n=1 Tax=Rhodobacterales TaxID=204455 RepID=UPI0006DB6146|nr:LPS export ABC transporter periplasmic protein LptC [Phaeobacter sp. CECT 5382]CUH87157.1 Organic solvent tolerance protein OstA [Phaeobacter sp. CECT 5382]
MDQYSRMVSYLKVLLPLAALMLLSTLFLISRGADTEAVIPFADREIEERMRGQQVTGPFFSGSTAQGDEIWVTATKARAGADSPMLATDLSAEIRMAAGGRLTLRSDRGTVQPDQDLARFIGNVEITTADGMQIQTEALKTHLSGLRAESPGDVRARSDFGDLTAGRLEISSKTQGGPVHLLFTKGVKLVYDPKKLER